MIEERSRSVNDDRLNDDRLFLAGSDENGGNPDIMMILLSSVSSSSDVKQKRFIMPVVYEDNRAVPSTLINAPTIMCQMLRMDFGRGPRVEVIESSTTHRQACVFLVDRWWTGFVCNWRWD